MRSAVRDQATREAAVSQGLGAEPPRAPRRVEEIDRIKRRSLHDEVVERLRDMIVDGTFAPGSRVPERLLCERFGISRTPLREALKVLASEGLLELLPNRGARVSTLTGKDIEELFEVLGVLEALSGELACARMDEDGIRSIRAQHEAMVDCYRRGALLEYFNLNQDIHQAIMDGSGNGTLMNVYRGLAGRVRRARYMANLSDDRWRQAVEEHEAILEALTARDGPRLSTLLLRHLRNKCEAVKAAVGQR
jgi:DNA-binding GntR family transcriptional regulator